MDKPFWKNPVWLAFCAGIIYMYAVMLYFNYMEALRLEKIHVFLTKASDPSSDDNKRTDTPTTTATGTSRPTKRTRGKIMPAPLST